MSEKIKKLKKYLSFNKLFGNNKFVLVLSFFIAIVLWVTFVLGSKTETARTFNEVPVNIDTSGMLSYLQIVDGEDQTVSVRLVGNRLALNAIDKDDITLTAQIGAGYVTGSGTFPFNITGSVNSQDVRISSINPQTIQISFDSYTSKTLPLEIVEDRTNAAEGYVKNNTVSDIDSIVVSGPSSVLQRIASAEVSIDDPETLSATKSYSVPVKLYTEQRNEINIEKEGLELNSETVTLTVPILKRYSIELNVNFINQPTEYLNDPIDYTMVPRSVEVAAPVDAQMISGITVGTIDFRDIEPGAYFEFDIELPREYISIDNVTKATVTPSTYGLDSIQMDVTEFIVTGVPATRSVEVLNRQLSKVEIIGPESILANITTQDVYVEIQWSDISAGIGETVVPAKIKVRNYSNCWAFGKYEAIVKIS